MGRIIHIPRPVLILPASIIFNGSDEYLTRAFSTSGANATIFTASIWVKGWPTSGALDTLVSSEDPAGANVRTRFGIQNSSGDAQLVYVDTEDATSTLDAQILTTGDSGGNDGNWHHLVFRIDSTQGTQDNRCRMYQDGSLLSDAENIDIGLNDTHHMFVDGSDMYIGSLAGVTTFYTGKLAFIDVLEGVSAPPTDFAFDDGGTWTRQPYAGSYGTYGFSIDGTSGFNDVSGNGQHFTGNNMTLADNLDKADLPPYIS